MTDILARGLALQALVTMARESQKLRMLAEDGRPMRAALSCLAVAEDLDRMIIEQMNTILDDR